ncbi:Radical SAM superfamily protein [Prunus dulcis]|uniref:Radical SAM superfamily protein n=1 Tax=Prunus dulcis TaxID=3755 RepID=A0A4Y1QQD9_PRUDU|nr:Radical SAM superfamily protein [Prunus dulcis]
MRGLVSDLKPLSSQDLTGHHCRVARDGRTWMRRILLRQNSLPLLKPPMACLLTPATLQKPISSPFLKPSPPTLAPLASSHRRSLSTATACSLPDPLVSLDGISSYFGGDDGVGTSNKGLKVLLKGMTYDELEKWVQSHGYRPGQALMLWKRLYGNGLNKDFKKMLSENAEFKALSLKQVITAADGTRKEYCLCFKSSGLCHELMGLRRHLTAAEIVEQAVFARCLLTNEVGDITNVGMGEPLQNIDNVLKATDIMLHDQGLHFSPRKITVSTSGLVPQLRRFLKHLIVRNWIMPINRKYNIGLLLQTLREELRFKNNYKVLLNIIEDARRLADLVRGIPCKINLLSFNPHGGSQFRPTSDEKMIEFRNLLAEAGCVVFLRSSRGDDQMAACGQLGNPGAIQAPLLRVPEQFKMAMEVSV